MKIGNNMHEHTARKQCGCFHLDVKLRQAASGIMAVHVGTLVKTENLGWQQELPRLNWRCCTDRCCRNIHGGSRITFLLLDNHLWEFRSEGSSYDAFAQIHCCCHRNKPFRSHWDIPSDWPYVNWNSYLYTTQWFCCHKVTNCRHSTVWCIL